MSEPVHSQRRAKRPTAMVQRLDALDRVQPAAEAVRPGLVQRMKAMPTQLLPDDVTYLQRTIGNRAVARLLAPPRGSEPPADRSGATEALPSVGARPAVAGTPISRTAGLVVQRFRDLDNGGQENGIPPVGMPGRMVGGTFMPGLTGSYGFSWPFPSPTLGPTTPPMFMPPMPSFSGSPVTPASTMGTPSTAPSFTPPTSSPTSTPPVSTPTSPAGRKPWLTKLSKKGKSTHFDAKLPPRTTRKSTLKGYGGPADQKKFKGIYEKTERSGLPDSLTRTLREQAEQDLAAGRQVTPEARSMAEDSSATLSGIGAQRNHTVAAETGLVGFAAGLAVLTDHGTDAPTRKRAREQMITMSKRLTGNDRKAVKRVTKRLEDVDSDLEEDAAAELASDLTHVTADHPYNVGLGHGGRNMGMSNRIDVTASPHRTTMSEQDADILEGVENPFRFLVGDELAEGLLAVPMSPGGQHIMSSKTWEEEDDSSSDS